MSKPNASKIFTIIQHEYLIRVKTKGFVIGTLLGPLGMLLLIAIPIVVTLLSADTTEKRIAVIDKSNKIGTLAVKKSPDKYYLTEENEETLKKATLEEEIDGYLLIPEDILTSGEINVFTRGGGGIGFVSQIESVFGRIVRHERLLNAGADTSVINLVDRGITLETQKITQKGEEKDFTEAYAMVGYFFGFVIYIMMLLYGTMVMRGVIEEKANRIIEVIASSAKPFEIMFGKVFGIGLVGLTQVLIWVVIGAGLIAAVSPIMNLINPTDMMPAQMTQQGMAQAVQQASAPNFEIPSISLWLVIGFIFYFLSGYFVYATLFAAVGSAVDQEQDAQQLQWPVTIPIIIPMLFIGSVIGNPDSMLSIVLSLVPFFSPMLMVVRVAATNVPVWQIGLSVVLMISSFIVSLWVAAKIYRVGILMYGKKPSVKDLVKWFMMAK